ncbi:MAG: LysR family transcriptional regulator [Bacillota bacterium]|nr:LysR family transcriptional regulator [Bacillota bacterium]
MSFRRIEYFLAVARHLSFTKAARECYVAQAAISQQIKQFEEELGFQLFDRGGTSVSLTPAGEYFARRCQSVLTQYNGAVKQARTIADGEKQVLRVGFHGLSAQKIFAGHLRRFRAAYPEVAVTIQEANRDALLEDLRRGELDLIVAPDSGLVLDQGLDILELASTRSRFMISAGSPLAGRPVVAAAELTGLPLLRIQGKYGGNANHQRTDYYTRLGLGDNPVQWARNYFELLLMVEAGMGIAAIPSGAEEQLPEDVAIFELEGDAFRINTVALRLVPPVSVPADHFFRLMRQAPEEVETAP